MAAIGISEMLCEVIRSESEYKQLYNTLYKFISGGSRFRYSLQPALIQSGWRWPTATMASFIAQAPVRFPTVEVSRSYSPGTAAGLRGCPGVVCHSSSRL